VNTTSSTTATQELHLATLSVCRTTSAHQSLECLSKCYTVVQDDTILTVAANSQLVMLDAAALKNANLDILYGGRTLYAGMQLRLPIHSCFEDEIHDCHIATDGDTLQNIATMYHTTPQQVCKSNPESFGTNYCDPGIQPLPGPHTGMELRVPTLRPNPPTPCRDVPGYWSCYTVKANETISPLAPGFGACISMEVSASADELIELNFGRTPKYCGNCSNFTACPPGDAADKQRGPGCLRIGQVLTIPVAPPCIPRPGVWECMPTWYGPYQYGNCIGMDFPSTELLTEPLVDLFCKANRRAFTGCRNRAMSWGDVKSYVCSANQTVKIPTPICMPNDKSYCSGTNSTVDGDIYHQWDGNEYCSDSQLVVTALSSWDGNAIAYPDWGVCFSSEYHIPRASLPGLPDLVPDVPLQVNCTPVPGKYICHKPLPPISNGTPSVSCCKDAASPYPCTCFNWTDSVYEIAQRFGIVDWKVLCKFNNMANCSALNSEGSALKIPVTPAALGPEAKRR
jgi:hypothetical protein